MFNIYVLLVLFYILQFVVSFILDPLGGVGIRCIAANSCWQMTNVNHTKGPYIYDVQMGGG